MAHNVNKITAERNQRTLLELAAQPGNDVCADCKTRNPRWASHNLGIFICMSCASIHRKMGTHVSKVKSLTMDSWTKEQVEVMKSNGNIKSNAHYNPDEIRHPPPTNMIDSERDSDLEKYIRSKYEYKSFISRSSQVAALLGPSRSSSSRISAGAPPRSQTVPAPGPSTTTITSSTAPPVPALDSGISRTQSQFRSVSQPAVPSVPPITQQYVSSSLKPAVQQPPPSQPQHSSNPVWNDLAQLQAPSVNSSLPLQYASPMSTQPMNIPSAPTGLTAPSAYGGLSVSPGHQFPSSFQQTSGGMFPGGQVRSMSLNTGLNVGGFGAGTSPGMLGTSPSMMHPQPTLGGLSTPATGYPPNSTPSPNPYAPQALTPVGLGMQQQQPGSFAPPSPFGQPSQPFLQAQPQQQQQQQFQPQGSPMFPTQQLQFAQGSPMLQAQPLGQPQMGMQFAAAGNPFMQQQQQQQQQQPQFGQQQQPFMGAQPSALFGQMQQQQPYGQGSAFGGTGWPQQQWGGV